LAASYRVLKRSLWARIRNIAGSAFVTQRPKMKPPMKTTTPGKETFEKIENSDGADAHKVEDSSLDAQIREQLVQALEDSVAALEIGFLHEDPRCSIGCE